MLTQRAGIRHSSGSLVTDMPVISQGPLRLSSAHGRKERRHPNGEISVPREQNLATIQFRKYFREVIESVHPNYERWAIL